MRCDEPLTGHGVVLSLARPMRELRVGGATRAITASGAIGSLCARDGAILAESARTCMMSCVLSELPRLRFWHSHEKTIEIVARLVEDGDWNVRATVLSAMCSLAF